MAAWLISALALLTPFALRGVAAARRARVPVAAGLGVAAGNIGIPGVDLFPGGGGPGGFDGGPRRRRRRRALTASDRADIAFIAGTLDKASAKSFALIIATRT